jgi:hypothetical protein
LLLKPYGSIPLFPLYTTAIFSCVSWRKTKFPESTKYKLFDKKEYAIKGVYLSKDDIKKCEEPLLNYVYKYYFEVKNYSR